MIKPTVGRVVWFQPAKSEDEPLREQPLAAIIAYVWNDRMVNLGGFDENGAPFAATSVTLIQEEDDTQPASGYFAQWMPYQVGQAKKDETAAQSTSKESRAAALNRVSHHEFKSTDEFIAAVDRLARYIETGVTSTPAYAAQPASVRTEINIEGNRS